MTGTDRDDDARLEPWFAAMRDAPAPGDDLVVRVLADADRLQHAPVQVRRVGWSERMRMVLDELGGWPAMTGLATSAVAGIWIGMAAPDRLTGMTQSYFGAGAVMDTVDLPEAEFFVLDEGAL